MPFSAKQSGERKQSQIAGNAASTALAIRCCVETRYARLHFHVRLTYPERLWQKSSLETRWKIRWSVSLRFSSSESTRLGVNSHRANEKSYVGVFLLHQLLLHFRRTSRSNRREFQIPSKWRVLVCSISLTNRIVRRKFTAAT